MAALLKYNAQKHQESRNFLFFLIALAAAILFPGLLSDFLPSRGLFRILYIVCIVAGVYNATSNLRQLQFGLLFGVLDMIMTLLSMQITDPPLLFLWINFIVSTVFFTFLFIMTLRQVFKYTEVDLQTIYASLCGYLLLGVIAVIIFNFVHYMIPEAYNIGSDESFQFLYFSFVTLTTLGYGDITPVHAIPRTLVIFFAVTGQLYLTVLIAMLVGKYVSRSNKN